MTDLKLLKKESNMVDNLTKLYNTFLLIETRGESTKIMAQCLQFLENMIDEERSKKTESKEDNTND